jgi:hypothetical protein
MSTKIPVVLIGIVAALALAAGSAGAPLKATTITFSAQNFGDGSAACAPGGFGLSFDMISPAGALLGTGVSCILSSAGCDPFVAFVPGCHSTTEARFELHFANGSVTAPMKLFELYRTPTAFLQVGVGKISAGTGAFAGARGIVDGGGTGAFTDTGLDSQIVYTVHALV